MWSIFKKTEGDAKKYLVVDVGTTGVRAIIFDEEEKVLARSYRLIKSYNPQPGWVEQDPHDLYAATVYVIQNVLSLARLKAQEIEALGLTNQRETVVGWDRRNNMPVYPAIVWEDERTKSFCRDTLSKHANLIRETSGLSADSYFSASKIRWIMKNVSQAEKIHRQGALVFGTVDSWILWNLTDGEAFATDYTNASRTLLFDIRRLKWSPELLSVFNIPAEVLPEIRNPADDYGFLRRDIIGGNIPIRVLVGDQQASAAAAGTERGVTKVTYGTGTFIMQMLGERFELHDGWFTTLVPGAAGPRYALEGKIACCGKKIAPLLKDPVRLQKVLLGLADEVASGLKRLPYPTREIVVDGGVSQSEFLLLNQAEVAGVKIKKQKISDGTALGVLTLLLKRVS